MIKPACFICTSSMKVMYIRENGKLLRITRFYHCRNCNITQSYVEEYIPLINIIVRYARYKSKAYELVFKLNLKKHLYKLDIQLDECQYGIEEICKKSITKHLNERKYFDLLKHGKWTIDFNEGNIHISLVNREITHKRDLLADFF